MRRPMVCVLLVFIPFAAASAIQHIPGDNITGSSQIPLGFTNDGITDVWTAGGKNPSIFAGTSQHGLLRSTDGGSSWNFVNAGLPSSVGAASVDPVLAVAVSESAPSRVYAITETAGVYRSSTYGTSWERASGGLPVPFMRRSEEPSLLAVDPSDAQRVYALLTIPVTSHRARRVLFHSGNGGSSWEPVKDLSDSGSFARMAVDDDGKLTLHSNDDSRTIVTPQIFDASHGGMSLKDLLGVAAEADEPAIRRLDADVNNIALMHDDGTLVFREFDLANRSLEFRPTSGGYQLTPLAANYDADHGSPFELFDDDSRRQTLPFPFTFYGKVHQTVFINSNGSISFEGGERSSTETASAFLNGRPRIAPLWADLDPAATGGGVFIKLEPARLVVTWNEVREWQGTTPNTFQIILYSDGRIHLNYRVINLSNALTGISPGYQTAGFKVSISGHTGARTYSSYPIYQLFAPADIDIARVAQYFYRRHEDAYDALVVFGSSDYEGSVVANGVAYFAGVANGVRGIGLGVGSGFAAALGSERLQGLINMNTLDTYPDGITDPIPGNNDSLLTVLGQEWGHRFSAFVRFRDERSVNSTLLGRQGAHWNYFLNSEGSLLEGVEWRDDGDSNFTAIGSTYRYSRLDQYLMGLRSASEVPDLMLITNPQHFLTGPITALASTFGRTDNAVQDSNRDFGPPDHWNTFRLSIERSGSLSGSVPISASGRTEAGVDPTVISTRSNLRTSLSAAAGQQYVVRKTPDSSPQAQHYERETGRFTGSRIVVKGTRRNISLSSIIDYEGERLPRSGQAPTAFRVAFVLLVPEGRTATAADMAKISALRTEWEPFYRRATDGLSTMATDIISGASHFNTTLAGGGMHAIGSVNSAPTGGVGYATLESSGDQLAGVAFLTGRSGTRIVTEAAVPAGGTQRRGALFVERSTSVNTGIALVSPHTAATVTLELRGADGAIMTTATLNIPGGGHVSRFVDQFFTAAPATIRGSLTFSATAPVAVVALRSLENDAREFLITTIPVADPDRVTPAVTYLPHFADGGGYSTDTVLLNNTPATATGVVEFRASDGTPMSLTINGAAASSARYSMAPNGSQTFSTGIGAGALRSGYITIRADDGQAGVAVQSVITLRQNGRVFGMTGMYPAVSSTRSRLFVDLTALHDSGLAVLNPGSAAANLRLTVMDARGQAVAGPLSLPLNGRAQTARMVREMFPNLATGFQGTIEVSSDVPVQIVTLRTTVTDDRVLLAAFPVEPLDVPRNERILYFPHLVDGSGYSLEIFQMNIGSSSSFSSLLFRNQTGQPLRLLF